MDAHPRYTLVGILVSLILLALVLWLSWLWRAGARDQTASYVINFRQHSLAGLQIDGIVSMRGMRVGTIKQIELDPTDIENVRVRILVNKNVLIKSDTQAVVARNLLTGLASIDLIGTSQSGQILQSNDGALPVIAEGRGGTEQIFKDIPNLVVKAADTLERVNYLLNEDNILAFHKLLVNLEAASTKLPPVLNALELTLADLQGLSTQTKSNIEPLFQSLRSSTEEVRIVLQSISSDFSRLTKNIAAAAENLKQPRTSVLGLPSGQFGPGEEQ